MGVECWTLEHVSWRTYLMVGFMGRWRGTVTRLMYTPHDRCQLRAALALWQQVAANSRTHPAHIPACQAIFMYDGFRPMSAEKIDALMQTLEHDVVYITVSPAAKRYGVNATKLRRELSSIEAIPVPGTAIFNLSDVILCVNRIRKREAR